MVETSDHYRINGIKSRPIWLLILSILECLLCGQHDSKDLGLLRARNTVTKTPCPQGAHSPSVLSAHSWSGRFLTLKTEDCTFILYTWDPMTPQRNANLSGVHLGIDGEGQTQCFWFKSEDDLTPVWLEGNLSRAGRQVFASELDRKTRPKPRWGIGGVILEDDSS